ncbi:MAG: class D sortase [Firmicutes bacterium]|nr:class D sortase [Bacillota bacterium]
MKKLGVAAGVAVILVGLTVASYPWLKAMYFSRLQASAIDAWLAQPQAAAVGDEPRIEPLPAESSAPAEPPAPAEPAPTQAEAIEADLMEEDVNAAFDVQYVLQHMEGIITIQKIGLKSPIVTGASAHNLNIAVCSVDDTGKMGQTGNYVLAGHKSRVRGRHFNRLSELAPGDEVVTENKQYLYTYAVTEIFSVTPEDTWVMDQVSDKKQITLITCDYRMNPIGRLIVKGELESETEK